MCEVIFLQALRICSYFSRTFHQQSIVRSKMMILDRVKFQNFTCGLSGDAIKVAFCKFSSDARFGSSLAVLQFSKSGKENFTTHHLIMNIKRIIERIGIKKKIGTFMALKIDWRNFNCVKLQNF